MNTGVIRRLTLKQLERSPLADLFLTPVEGCSKDELFSETTESDDVFALVDERGLHTRQMHHKNGWHYRSVDKLIGLCSKPEARAAALAEEKKNNTYKGGRKGNGPRVVLPPVDEVEVEW